MAKAAIAFVLASTVAMAGCLAGNEHGEPTPQGDRTAFATDLAFSECRAWYGIFTLPSRLHPGSAPAGWEAPSSAITTLLGVEVFECERVSFGHLERGPVTLATEWHSNVSVPSTCAEHHEGDAVISNVIVDDPDIAKALQEDLGLPATAGKIVREPTSIGVVGQVDRWSISVGDHPASTLEIPIGSSASGNGNEGYFARFWDNGNGISAMDMHDIGKMQDPNPVAVYGTFRAPMEGSEWPGGTSVGHGGMYNRLDTEATTTQYEDYTCETPSS